MVTANQSTRQLQRWTSVFKVKCSCLWLAPVYAAPICHNKDVDLLAEAHKLRQADVFLPWLFTE